MTHKTVEEIVQDLVFRFCNRGNVERADGSHYSQTELEEEVREALTTATEEAERRGEERMKRAQKQTDEYFQLRLNTALEQQAREEIDENTSDGYHTFKELYEFRLLYNAHLFNEWAKQGMYDVHKSQRHSDGELCFGRTDYFIVVATLPTGQISNHYPMSDWDLFECEVVEKAKHHWDGHTSQDVATRLRDTLISHKKQGLDTNTTDGIR